MVESKHSLYDDSDSYHNNCDPPLVPAVSAPLEPMSYNTNAIMVESEEVTIDHHDSSNDGYPPLAVMADVSSTSSSSSSTESTESNDNGDERASERMIGAGVAGGVLGLLIGGPIFAAIAGFGVAYCTRKEDAAGDVARALGDVALSAKEKAQEVESKHHLVESTTNMAASAWEKAKELDRQTEVLNKVSTVLSTSVNTTVDFARRHRIVERSVDVVGSSVYFVMEKLAVAMATAPKLIAEVAANASAAAATQNGTTGVSTPTAATVAVNNSEENNILV